MNWQLLGDQALLTYCPDEGAASSLAEAVRHNPPLGVQDIIQAYSSVAVFLDLRITDAMQARNELSALVPEAHESAVGRCHRVSVCYELGLDLERIKEQTGLSVDRIIQLHLGQVYTVYAIGFCPGFPYLGYLPPELQAMPRLPSPRLQVEAGSVGLTGKQTGIYTEARPGGWNIVGRTPLTMVNVADNYFPLRTGDQVQFQRIDDRDFLKLKGERLEI